MNLLKQTMMFCLLLFSFAIVGQEQLTDFRKFEEPTGYGRTIQNIDGIDYFITRRDQGIIIDKFDGDAKIGRVVLDQRPLDPEEVNYNVLQDCVFDRYLVEVYKTEIYVFDIVTGVFVHKNNLELLGVGRIFSYQEKDLNLYMVASTSDGNKFVRYNIEEDQVSFSDFSTNGLKAMNGHFAYRHNSSESTIEILDLEEDNIVATIDNGAINDVTVYENGYGPQLLIRYVNGIDFTIINHENLISDFSCTLPSLEYYTDITLLDNKLCLYRFDPEEGSYMDVYDAESCSFLINQSVNSQLYGELYHHKYFGDDFLILDMGTDFEGTDGVKYFIQISTATVQYVFTKFQRVVKGNVSVNGDQLVLVGRDGFAFEGTYYSWRNLWIINKNTLSEREEFFGPSFAELRDIIVPNREFSGALPMGYYVDLDSVHMYSVTGNTLDRKHSELQYEFNFGVKNVLSYKADREDLYFYSNDSMYRIHNGSVQTIEKSLGGSEFIVLEDEVAVVNRLTKNQSDGYRFDRNSNFYTTEELEFFNESLDENSLTSDHYVFGFGRLGDYYDFKEDRFGQVYFGIDEMNVNGHTTLLRGAESTATRGYYFNDLSQFNVVEYADIPDVPLPVYPDGRIGYYIIQNKNLPHQVHYVDGNGAKSIVYESASGLKSVIFHDASYSTSCLVVNEENKAIVIGEINEVVNLVELPDVEIGDFHLSNKTAILTSNSEEKTKYLYDLDEEINELMGDVNTDDVVKFSSNAFKSICLAEDGNSLNIYSVDEGSKTLDLLFNFPISSTGISQNEEIFPVSESIFLFPFNDKLEGHELYAFDCVSNQLYLFHSSSEEQSSGVGPLHFDESGSYIYYTALDEEGYRQWFRIERDISNVEEEVQNNITVVPSLTNSIISVNKNFDRLSIYSQSGELQIQVKDYSPNKDIDVSELPNGIYIIYGFTDGIGSSSSKFVKIGN